MEIGVIGFGTVGQGVVELLARHRERFCRRVGEPLDVSAVLVRDASKRREVELPAGCLVTEDPAAFFGAGTGVVVEVAGGTTHARTYVRHALEGSRDVVTANKSLLAAHGPELFAVAESFGRRLAFEASVAGGVPIVAALTRGLGANAFDRIEGILNGTCNFVLSRMAPPIGSSYALALSEAQRLGYAEADPSLDVSGRDTAEKLAILSTLAFGRVCEVGSVSVRGVEEVTAEDVRSAAESGEVIKLVGVAEASAFGGEPELRVEPARLAAGHPLAGVEGSRNAVWLRGDAVGEVLLTGAGAGRFPTASAVVSDVLGVALFRRLREQGRGPVNPWPMPRV